MKKAIVKAAIAMAAKTGGIANVKRAVREYEESLPDGDTFSTTFGNVVEILAKPDEEVWFGKKVVAKWDCGCEFNMTSVDGGGILFACKNLSHTSNAPDTMQSQKPPLEAAQS